MTAMAIAAGLGLALSIVELAFQLASDDARDKAAQLVTLATQKYDKKSSEYTNALQRAMNMLTASANKDSVAKAALARDAQMSYKEAAKAQDEARAASKDVSTASEVSTRAYPVFGNVSSLVDKINTYQED